MIGKTDANPQLNVFRVPLVNVINMKHLLVELSHRIDWTAVDKDFMLYYSGTGRPAVPVRKMVGCILLKKAYNLSDEAFISRWIDNPYWQYFCGETYFQFTRPFNHGEFGQFRKRIGKEGDEKLLKLSNDFFNKEILTSVRGHRTSDEKFLSDHRYSRIHWIKRLLTPAQKLRFIFGFL